MRTTQSILKWFLSIAIIITIGNLIWMILTPSLSADTFLWGYSLPRFVIISGIALFFILLVCFLLFSNRKRVSDSFEKIFSSKITFWFSFLVAFLSLVLICGSFFDVFQKFNPILIRFLPAVVLVFLLSLEIFLISKTFYLADYYRYISKLPVKSLSKDQRIGLLVLIIIVGFSAAVLFHYIQGVYNDLDYPYNTFLFEPPDRFNDFFNPLKGSFDLDPYNPERIGFIGGYLPLGYLVSFLFSLIQLWTLSLGIFLSLFMVFLWFFIRRCLYGNQNLQSSQVLNLFALTLLTYPVLFMIDRANFDIIVLIGILLFAWFYKKGNRTIAALMLAVPIAMKGYPLVLMAIPLLDKRFKDILLTGGLVVLLEIISLSIFKDGLVLEFQKMVTSFGTAFSIAFEQGSLIRFNSSLYTFILFLQPSLASTAWFGKLYVVVALIVFAGIMLIMFKKKVPFWKSLFLITIVMILFPQSSADYRLCMLYPPILLFLIKEEKSKWDSVIAFLAGLMLVPKAYYIFYSDVNLGIILNPILLILLFLTLLFIDNPVSLNHDQVLEPKHEITSAANV